MRGILAGVTATLLLAGCSGAGVGSGNSSTAPSAPVLFWAPQAGMSFAFTWSDTTGETQYRLLEDPDSRSGYAPIATLSANVTDHTLQGLPLIQRLNARYILQACNSVGCTDSAPVHITGNLAAAIGSAGGSNAAASDEPGFSLALSEDGNTFAVGAPGEDSNATGVNGIQGNDSAADSGAVYVFIRGGGGSWSQQAYLKASNTEANDLFGQSVSFSSDGNTLAVGAHAEDSSATGVNGEQGDNSAADSGAVYVFSRSGGTWSPQAYLKAANSEAGDQFGGNVALSGDGNTLAVTASGEDSNATGVDGNQGDNSAADSGAVHVFARSGITWNPQAYLKAANSTAFDGFGSSVALSGDGNTLAVGVVGDDSGFTYIDGSQGTADSGAVHVFTRSSGSWSTQAWLKASDAMTGDHFGSSVALSTDGNSLAVGARSRTGSAYLFNRNFSAWSQQFYLKNPEREAAVWFGRSLALSGDGMKLVIGTSGSTAQAYRY
jgi:hypothetical protein